MTLGPPMPPVPQAETLRRSVGRQLRDAKWAILAAITLVVSLAAALAPYLRAEAHESIGRAPDGEYTFVGRGWGHGRGLSQYGAYRAAKLGKSAKTITDFYYGRSRLATVNDRTMRILLSATNGDRFVRYPNASGLSATAYRSDGSVLASRALAGRAWWRVVTDSSGLRVQYLDGTAWRNVGMGGRTAFARVSVKASGALALYDEDGGSRVYRGSYHVTRLDARRIRVVNHVALERQYLRSVVPSESPASWPQAALAAQAIAARSYAVWYERNPRARDYDLCDTTACQVYRGVSSENSRTDKAVAATKGQARVTDGKTIRAEYSSSNGGSVVTGGTGHSTSRYDPWSDGSWDPKHRWTKDIKASAIATSVFGSGTTLTRITIGERNGYGDWGGRVLSVTFHGSRGGSSVKRTLTGEQVRSKLRLYSAYFTIGGSTDTRWVHSSGLSKGAWTHAFTYGPKGAVVAGDWNGNRSETAAVLTRSSGRWLWRPTNSNNPGATYTTFRYGSDRCIPVAGDWNGNGRDSPGVVCASNGSWVWHLRNAMSAGGPSYRFAYGSSSCRPVVGDWNGDRRDTPGVACPSGDHLRWRLRNANSAGSPSYNFTFGAAGATPVVGDWNGDRKDTIGTATRSGDTWVWRVRNANSAGSASGTFSFGTAAQQPIAGDWNGNGLTTAGVTV
jgi:stage II sporulation protein D